MRAVFLSFVTTLVWVSVLAVVFVVWAAAQVVVMGDQLEPNRLVGGAAMIVVCAGVAWRRQHPSGELRGLRIVQRGVGDS